MSFQAVRAVFEAPVIAALAGLDTPVPCYVDNQSFTIPDAGQEYATINLSVRAVHIQGVDRQPRTSARFTGN